MNNGDGWILDLRQYFEPSRLDRGRRAVLLVPGYCMNTTPLAYHPTGRSLIEFLTDDGIEVWTANLRGQGDSKRTGGKRNVGFETLICTDLASAVRAVRSEKRSERDEIDAIGCSLGGTFLYAYLALTEDHGVHSVVGMGAPLRWAQRHPALKIAFASPRLAALVRVRGTRAAARRLLPIARRFPAALSIYMNTDHVDLSDPDRLVETVEDPIPRLNGEIAQWLKNEDLVVAGVDVTERTRRLDRPVLSVYANRDGIVPPHAATAVADVMAGENVDLLRAGDDTTWYAHADLFIGRTCQERVFTPLTKWLRARH